MNESELSVQDKLLLSEIKRLEQEDEKLIIQLEKSYNLLNTKEQTESRLQKNLDKLKDKVLNFISEENIGLSQKDFLYSEYEKLRYIYDSVSDKYEENMKDVEDIMKDVGFMKGEIETLQSQTQILEAEIPYAFKNSENLDNRVKITFFRALNNIQRKINDVQKRAEVIYYKKGEM